MNVSCSCTKEKWYDALAYYSEPSVYYGLPCIYEEEDEGEDEEETVETDEEW